MAVYTFGSGYLWGTRTDISNPTPRQFGTLQDVSIDFTSTTKPLYGSKQFPVAIGRGTAKIQGKAKVGQLQGTVFSDLYFNTSLVAGRMVTVQAETAAIPATPYTITVSNGANFRKDLGVVFNATKIPLTLVASSPATGQYAVNATTGVYTFAAADTTLSVDIAYEWHDASTGQSMTFTNQDLGFQPVFGVTLREQFNAPGGVMQATLNLRAAISSKLTLTTKQEDFDIPEFDFECMADASGTVFDWSFSDAS